MYMRVCVKCAYACMCAVYLYVCALLWSNYVSTKKAECIPVILKTIIGALCAQLARL